MEYKKYKIAELLECNLFHAPALLASQLLQTCKHFGADAGCVVRKIDQISLAFFENLETEAVLAVEGDQRAKDGLDAAPVMLLVAGGAQYHGDLPRWMLFILLRACQWYIQRWQRGRCRSERGSRLWLRGLRND